MNILLGTHFRAKCVDTFNVENLILINKCMDTFCSKVGLKRDIRKNIFSRSGCYLLRKIDATHQKNDINSCCR